jgi:hypothetical protein
VQLEVIYDFSGDQ